MKNIKTRNGIIWAAIFLAIFFVAPARADIAPPPECRPGETPGWHCSAPGSNQLHSNTLNRQQVAKRVLLTYAMIGGAVVVVGAVSGVILFKLRIRIGSQKKGKTKSHGR